MKEEQMRSLLCTLLDCGYLDLRILDDVNYDFCDVIEETKEFGVERPDINALMFAVFELGKRDLYEAINNKIGELKESESDFSKEIEELQSLEPHEDIESFHNFLDTSVYITKKQELYEKYIPEALEHFEEMTGYSLIQ